MYTIYIAFKRLGEPLYVGRTTDLQRRIQQHRSVAPWLHQTNYFYVAECPTEADQVIREIYYINKLRPPYVQKHLYSECPRLKLPPIKFEKIDVSKAVEKSHKGLPSSSRLPTGEPRSSRKDIPRTPSPNEFVLAGGKIGFFDLFCRTPSEQRYFIDPSRSITISRMNRLTDVHVTFIKELIATRNPLLCCRDNNLSHFDELLDPYTEQVAIPLAESDVKLCLDLASNFHVKFDSYYSTEWSLFSVISGYLFLNGWFQLKRFWNSEFMELFVNGSGNSKLVKVVMQSPYGLLARKLG
ncbi:GIY-YIG nuclease family protein [Alicyclobacillus cycloheptanicus]|uniref:GIY-YIG domain-containing protein n=1 Tax=Alicyclobacillus cycloheptanicus TaxID=1457 RepID=A0ABT9XLF7_9BACL|nr:hypothetical protein [Alicyclobacillus cycloheptanicus]WDM01871.1 GIY-YIG nuclease family protein [Alicyclobacillus cycloheptanicus]